MYEPFYGLSRTPFAVTPDPMMLFMSRIHREALATIIYGVETRKGFIVCTGEVGTGKSTIIRAFFDQAGADSVKLIYIFTPQVTPFEMARFICRELDLDDPESIFAAVPRLQLKLLDVFESGRTVVLMIDEAQLLPPETLEFLRLLSNFETDTEKLIQIVLVGQPEVDTMLARRDMRQVNQRVALRARLGAFSIEESFDYIEHRLRVSGAADMNQVMSPSAAWLIAEAAGGIPRRINILADNALIAGFGAAQRPLGSQLAGIAVREFVAKSGAAGPVASQPVASGWRAARRLRGALAREKGEPVESVSVAPAPKTAAPPAAKPAVAPAAKSAVAPAGTSFVAPRTLSVPNVALPSVRRTVGPSVASPAARTAAAPVHTDPGRPAEPIASDGPAVSPAVPALAEPIATDWQVSRIAAGEPISTAGIAIVAPIIASPVAATEDETTTIGFGADPDASPAARADLAIPPRPAGTNGAAAQRRDAASAPVRPRVTGQWPALSRVRSDLESAPRRDPTAI